MAKADNVAPTLVSLTFPDRVDLTAGNLPWVPFTVDARDTGVGVDHVTIEFDRSLSGYSNHPFTIDEGGRFFIEGPIQSSAPFWAEAGGGRYTIVRVTVTDKAGNDAGYDTAALTALGIATTIDATSTYQRDTTPPNLTALQLPDLDVAAGVNRAAIVGHVTDDRFSLLLGELSFDGGFATVDFAAQSDGSIDGDLHAPPTAQSGTYNVTSAILTDQAGNVTTYTNAQLKTLGVDTDFTVTNPGAPAPAAADVTAPVLTSLTLPTTIDVSRASTFAPISAKISEIGSGVATIALQLSDALTLNFPYQGAAGHGGVFGGPVLAATLTAYSKAYGFYGGTIQFAQVGDIYNLDFNVLGAGVPISTQTSAGIYHVIGATITDVAGNVSTYSEAQLQALGGSTSITVVADEIAPTLTKLTLPGTVVANGAAQSVGFSLEGMDDGTGLATSYIHFDRGLPINFPSEFGSDYMLLRPASLASGSLVGGANFGARTAHGAYSIIDILLNDAGGNSRLYTAAELKALGFATSFTVAGSVASDFNGDAHSDILWTHRNGGVRTWSATSSGAYDTIKQDTFDARVDPSWKAVESFDWNGDGRSDILWRNANGNLSIWTGQASGLQQAAFGDTSVPPTWKIAAAGDLNGDGNGDILWRNDNGALSTWLSTGSGFEQNAYFHNAVDASWKVEGVGDFNGDHKADILWRNDSGALSVWNAAASGFQEGSYVHAPIDTSWHIDGVGDFNADGRDDLLWRNDNGAVSVWQGTATGFSENHSNASAPGSWSIAAVGEFEGDGYADILWRNSDGAVSIWQSGGSEGWVQNTYIDDSVSSDWIVVAHVFPM